MKHPKKNIAFQSGFSMLEILITLVVVATALLGTAGLQAYAMKTNIGGQFRNQAVFLSADIVERMEANRVAAVAGNYALAQGAAVPAASTVCNVGVCAPAQLAAYDVGNWQVAVAAILPQGTGVITLGAVTPTSANYSVVINWVDRATNQTSAGAAVNGAAGENFSITTVKTIRL